MIKIVLVLRMMVRMALVKDGAVGVRKDGKWNGALDGGEGGEDGHENNVNKWLS